MQFCLYLDAPLSRLPAGIPASACPRLVDCFTLDTDYPPQSIIPLLTAAGLSPREILAIDNETRCLPLPPIPTDALRIPLYAAGIAASLTCQPLLLLRGLEDSTYQAIRREILPEPLCLPDDAVAGFLHLTAEEMPGRAARYGLSLPADCMLAIADDYRTRLHRPPTALELSLLDLAYQNACTSPALCAPVELITDDARLHLAFADMMQKRNAMPHIDAPRNAGGAIHHCHFLFLPYLFAGAPPAARPRRFSRESTAHFFPLWRYADGRIC